MHGVFPKGLGEVAVYLSGSSSVGLERSRAHETHGVLKPPRCRPPRNRPPTNVRAIASAVIMGSADVGSKIFSLPFAEPPAP